MSFSNGSSEHETDVDSGIDEALTLLNARSSSFLIEAKGTRWEPLQALHHAGPPLRPSVFNIVAVHDPSRARMCLSWQRSFLEPLTGDVAFDEIVVGNEGYISDSDIALSPLPARPMESERLAAVRRQQYLLNPHLLVGDALFRQRESGEKVIRHIGRKTLDGVPHDVVEIAASPRPVQLFVTLDTHLVSRLVTYENDFPLGDVEIVVAFSNWRREGGFAFPFQVELSWEGVVLHSETRQRVAVDPQLSSDKFALPETAPFDPEAAERGVIHAQWIHRALAMGAPIRLDAGKVVPVPLTKDVVTMGGGVHHSLAIALDSGIVVVDSPQHEERSLAVIDAVTATWPNKPITHMILTHHHYDHSGGIRAYAAIGAELIVPQADGDFVKRCLDRPHTIQPDTLARTDARPAIKTVSDSKLSLGDGEIEIHRISSPHSAENLVVYIRRIKLLFNADLFNPGLVKPGTAPPPYWLMYSKNFLSRVEALNLDIEILLGAHGSPEGGPYQELIDFTK